MGDSNEDMIERIQRMPDEEILQIIEAQAEDYTPETIDLVKAETASRGGVDRLHQNIQKNQQKELDAQKEREARTKRQAGKVEEVKQKFLEEKSNVALTQPKFQTAANLGRIIAAVGWIVIVLIIIGAMIVLATVPATYGLGGIALLVIGIPLGLQIVVSGQLLQATISIENNTDKSAQLLEKLLHNVKGNDKSL